MKNSIVLHHEDGSQQEFVGGRDFVEAVAKASSAKELRRILNAGGVSGFSEEAHYEARIYYPGGCGRRPGHGSRHHRRRCQPS